MVRSNKILRDEIELRYSGALYFLSNHVTVLYAASIVAVNGVHSGGAVVSCLRGNRRGSNGVIGIRYHGSALNRVKDNPGKG